MSEIISGSILLGISTITAGSAGTAGVAGVGLAGAAGLSAASTAGVGAAGAAGLAAAAAVGLPVAAMAVVLALNRRIYQQAGVPIGDDLLARHPGDVNQLFARWRGQLSQTQQKLATTVPLASASRAKALDQTLAQLPVLKEVATHVQPQSLQQAQVALKEMNVALARGNNQLAEQHAKLAQTRLEEVVAASYDRLASAQQSVVREVVAETLSDMGYQVQQRDTGRRSAVWATRGAQSIAFVLEQDGSFQMDTYGFTGLSCQQERNALLERLAEKGVRLQVRQTVLHGDRYGGQLMKKALATAKQQKKPVPDALLQATAPRNAQDDLRRRQQIVWGQRIAH